MEPLVLFSSAPCLALLEVPLLWASVFMLIRHKQAYAPKASKLLWPYLAWVTLAAAINLGGLHSQLAASDKTPLERRPTFILIS